MALLRSIIHTGKTTIDAVGMPFPCPSFLARADTARSAIDDAVSKPSEYMSPLKVPSLLSKAHLIRRERPPDTSIYGKVSRRHTAPEQIHLPWTINNSSYGCQYTHQNCWMSMLVTRINMLVVCRWLDPSISILSIQHRQQYKTITFSGSPCSSCPWLSAPV
jgi:hypothetical protein